ncbi:hypothetical protein TNCV_2963101 [Trichonephila clavipes]|nr:hypothetical protein TNCV_2963101 [Trichonephila clavipes]
MKEVVRKKRPRFLRYGVLLLDEKTRPTLVDGNAKPYCNSLLGAPTSFASPNLAPSDFHLFLALKKSLA